MEILLLRAEMITRKVLDVLNVLTPTKDLSVADAKKIVERQLEHQHFTYVGYVDGNPVAVAGIIITDRLGHNGGRVSHIEEVAVKRSEQGKGYGLKLIKFLVDKAKKSYSYKVILDCKPELENFYSKAGFENSGIFMRQYIEED